MKLHAVIVVAGLLLCGPSSAQLGTLPFSGAPSGTVIQTLKIGAGGFIGSIDVAADGTKAIRTDTYGAYICKAPCTPAGTPGWSQVALIGSLPNGDPGAGLNLGSGVYEIRIAPSNTARLYMYFNGYVYRSDNSGASWVATGFSHSAANGSDQSTESFGPYLAIDPANADRVYVGTPSAGLFLSTNAGASFAVVSAVGTGSTVPPGAGQGGSNLIAFDTSAGTSGGVTQSIYVSTYGVGVYHSADGGGSWSQLNTTGMPTTHRHMNVTSTGVLYHVDINHAVKFYSGGAWSTISNQPLGNPTDIAVDPANVAHLVVIDDVGNTAFSANTASSWTVSQSPSRTATDVPWLANTFELQSNHGSVGHIVFDPSQTNFLYFAEGIGVWQSNPGAGSALAWTSQSKGIEQLVANWIISPPNGTPILTALDRPEWQVTDPTTYPSHHGINDNQSLNPIVAGWSADWCSSTPGTVVLLAQGTNNVEYSGISATGGNYNGFTFFTALGTPPTSSASTFRGGAIACGTPNIIVWELANNGGLYRTGNGGATWTASSTGLAQGDTGWHGGNFLNRQNVIADRVNTSTFYAYNSGTVAPGVYKSTDGGATFAISAVTGHISLNDTFNFQMRSVPGNAGNFYMSAGNDIPQGNIGFFECTDGGTVSCSAVANVKDVWAFGLGKAKPGGSGYPTIFIYGAVNGVFGLWRSDDHHATWISLSNSFPLNSFDTIKVLEGDSNTYGTFYGGTAGSGFIWGKLSAISPANDNVPAGRNAVA